jgi:hypothetical protein
MRRLRFVVTLEAAKLPKVLLTTSIISTSAQP